MSDSASHDAADLEVQYAAAFAQWQASDDTVDWDTTSADGVDSAAREANAKED